MVNLINTNLPLWTVFVDIGELIIYRTIEILYGLGSYLEEDRVYYD